MDPLLNPYRPGAGAPPPILAGRESELAAAETLLARLEAGRGERSIIITGLRGVGKTALLSAAEDAAIRHGWIAQTLEARSGLDFRAAVVDRTWVILRQLEHKRAVREALSKLAALIRRIRVREPESGIEISLELNQATEAGALEADLIELVRALGEAAASADTGVLFLLDELQLVRPAELEALCAAMHELSKRGLPVGLVAAGLPPLRNQILAAKTYAERLFTYRELGPLDRVAATAALVGPSSAPQEGGLRLEFEPEALDALLDACHGYPYFIQVFGHAAWLVSDGPAVTRADAEEALRVGRNELDSLLYAGRWERAGERGRRYMRAMARVGDGPVRTRDVIDAGGFLTHQAAAPTRDQLIRKGLVYSPARGTIAFTVPGFADYVRRLGNG